MKRIIDNVFILVLLTLITIGFNSLMRGEK